MTSRDLGGSSTSPPHPMNNLAAYSPIIIELAGFNYNKKLSQQYRDGVTSIYKYTSTLDPTPKEFAQFMREIHNVLLTCDIYLKILCFRIVRTCFKNPSLCCLIENEGMHNQIVQSLEKENEFIKERKEAWKVMYAFLKEDPKGFPISFGRSLIAIAGTKGDHMQLVCIELLRELCISNTDIFVKINGPKLLMDVALDPDFEKIQGSILLTFTLIYSDPSKRRYIRVFSDFRYLISPLSDVDFVSTPDSGEKNISVSKARWRASMRAFVFLMRSFFGLIQLTSDMLCFPFLVEMMTDSKVPLELINIILDGLQEICLPFFTKYCVSEKLSTNYGIAIAAMDASGGGNPFMRQVVIDSQLDKQQRTYSINGAAQPSKEPEKKKSIFAAASAFFSKSSAASSVAKPSEIVDVNNAGHNVKENRVHQLTVDMHHGDVGTLLANSVKVSTEGDWITPSNSADIYCSLLCCSFIHSNLLRSLIHLAIHSQQQIATRSKMLLVNILRMIFNTYPKTMNVELLILPPLLEYSTSSTNNSPFQSFKAAQILQELSDSLSLTHFSVIKKTTSILVNPSSIITKSMRLASIDVPSTVAGASYSTGSNNSLKTTMHLNEIFQNLTIISQGTSDLSLISSAKASEVDALRLSYAAPTPPQHSSPGITQSQRANLTKEMELSRIIGKDGKEPLKWDWVVTLNTLNNGLNSPGLIEEALNSKWIKRLSGFYRCELDDKAYFVNADWNPVNFIYTECACIMYKLLIDDEKGLKFLQSDRRGIFFSDLSSEIDSSLKEIVCKQEAVYSTQIKVVFRQWICSYSLAREYFTILGRLLNCNDAKKLLENTSCFQNLLSLGGIPAMDYLSRLVISSLAFTDRGIFSKFLFANWHGCKTCSVNLKKYLYTVLMVILQSRPAEFHSWCVDLLIDFMAYSKQDEILLNVFELACQDNNILRKIVSLLTSSFSIKGPRANIIYARFASIPDGIKWLQSNNLLSDLIHFWVSQGCHDSRKIMQQNLNKLLLPEYLLTNTIATTPLIIETDHFAALSLTKSSIGADLVEGLEPPSTVQLDMGAATVDLQGLLKCPWNIEVKNTQQSSSQIRGGSQIGEYIKLDTFVDTSSFHHPIHCSSTNDATRMIIIRGIVTNVCGVPEGRAVTAAKGFFMSTLTAGVCPINKDGSVGFVVPKVPVDDQTTGMSFSIATSTRESIFAKVSNTQNSQNSALTDSLDSFSMLHDTDIPASYQSDAFVWSEVAPLNRRSDAVIVKDLDDEEDLFSITVIGEPVVWIFSRKGPYRHPEYIDSYTKRPPTKGQLFLIEVQYHIKFKTDQPVFTPVGRHLYSELAATNEGSLVLEKEGLIRTLIYEVKSPHTEQKDFANDLLSLAHICSTNHGILLVLKEDAYFLYWLTQTCCTHASFNIRAICYQALCLLSKSKNASKLLSELNWECYHTGVTSVTVPRKISSLFNLDQVAGGIEPDSFTQQIPSIVPEYIQNLSPDPTQSYDSIEAEILTCIAKLPGITKLLADSKARIEHIKLTNPSVFDNPALYRSVLELFELYPFRLSVRREVVKLFSNTAKSI